MPIFHPPSAVKLINKVIKLESMSAMRDVFYTPCLISPNPAHRGIGTVQMAFQ